MRPLNANASSPRANACLLHPASASASAVTVNVEDRFTPLMNHSASPTAPALPGSVFAFCIQSNGIGPHINRMAFVIQPCILLLGL